MTACEDKKVLLLKPADPPVNKTSTIERVLPAQPIVQVNTSCVGLDRGLVVGALGVAELAPKEVNMRTMMVMLKEYRSDLVVAPN